METVLVILATVVVAVFVLFCVGAFIELAINTLLLKLGHQKLDLLESLAARRVVRSS